MRIVIIGAVAGGTSAAAKGRRNNEDAEIVIYDKDQFISYSGCGMPYYLGDEIEDASELIPRDPAFFQKKYNVEIRTGHQVMEIRPESRELVVQNLMTQERFTDTYDTLILATGAKANQPEIPGVHEDYVFTLRNMNDMYGMKSYLQGRQPKEALIIGSGFIGLEVCENLARLGIHVTILERLNQVTPGLDADMAIYVQEHLLKNNVTLRTGVNIDRIEDHKVILQNGEEIPTDLVLISIGVAPETELARSIGIKLGKSGGILVNESMETSIPGIYGCGDCIEVKHLITGEQVYRPLGSTANKTGRIAGDVVTGGNLRFRGILGTGIFKVFDLAVAQTGLSEREARQAGYDVIISHSIKPDRPTYLGGKELVLKGIADAATGRILGAQIIGSQGVDKRIDVFVTAITFGAKAEDLFYLDLAYAPPFATTKDPVMYSGMIIDNDYQQGRKLITPKDLCSLMESGESYQLIDTRTTIQYEKAHIETAVNIPHSRLRQELEHLNPELLTITYCNKGVTGNAAQNILLNRGFSKVYNLSGGHKNYQKYRESKRNEYGK